jgi:hypothetical protein
MWLPVTASDKIGPDAGAVNAHERAAHTPSPETTMSLPLVAAIVALLAWIALLFFSSVTAGAIHLLLALGTTLLVRWWALRA